MLTQVHPKIPMRDKAVTKDFYINKLGFRELGAAGFDEYLMIRKDEVEIHFFLFPDLDPKENYGQIYIRINDIREWYQALNDSGVAIHPNGKLAVKPWGQLEFSLLDPDNNCLTFGQSLVR